MKKELLSTFSIVAYDPESEEIGVAVTSKAFSVGSLVPWVKAGIGAVATQSLVNVALGPEGLQLLENGLAPEEVIEEFKTIDSRLDLRQLGIVDAEGRSTSFTGESCIPWAGGRSGKNYAVQGNILVGEGVIVAMEETFLNTGGSLAKRMVNALIAGQKAGGDARGKQSAALVVEKKGEGRAGYGDRKIDLRVEDHPTPVNELARLLEIVEVSDTLIHIQRQVSSGTLNADKAILKMKESIEHYKGKKDELWLNLATFQYSLGMTEAATESVKKSLKENPNMINIIKYYPMLGFLDDEFVNRFLKQ